MPPPLRGNYLHDGYAVIDDLKTIGGSANPDVWTGPRGPLVTLGFVLLMRQRITIEERALQTTSRRPPNP